MTKILIVEDDPMVAELNSRLILTMEGFGVPVITGDARDALAYLEKNSVDLILLDIYLPGMNGLELTRASAAGEMPSTPFSPRVASAPSATPCGSSGDGSAP